MKKTVLKQKIQISNYSHTLYVFILHIYYIDIINISLNNNTTLEHRNAKQRKIVKCKKENSYFSNLHKPFMVALFFKNYLLINAYTNNYYQHIKHITINKCTTT